MGHAQIKNAVVMEDQKTGKTVLMGYATYRDAQVNFKVPFDWDTLDVAWFTKELRETLARDLEVGVSKMDINERVLLDKMRRYSEYLKKQKSKVIIH